LPLLSEMLLQFNNNLKNPIESQIAGGISCLSGYRLMMFEFFILSQLSGLFCLERTRFLMNKAYRISPCMSTLIQPHDFVAGTLRLV